MLANFPTPIRGVESRFHPLEEGDEVPKYISILEWECRSEFHRDTWLVIKWVHRPLRVERKLSGDYSESMELPKNWILV